ncbi:MAG: hypothetical protein KDB79_14180 [Acidobacteria bacterium]|nr:hypothetical protein [Acidobacteriota bacterium]
MKKLSIISITFSLSILFAVAIVAPVAAQNTVEDQYWDLVKDSKEVMDFKSYLKEYPTGKFAAIANLKISQLSGQPGTNATSPNPTRSTPQNSVRVRNDPAGFTNYEVVQTSATTGAPNSLGEVSVVCPANKKVLGGGFWSNFGNEIVRVWRNYPVDDGGRQIGDRGWYISFTSVTSGQLIWVRAVCASVPNELGYEIVNTGLLTNASGTSGEGSVSCPANKKVLSGGYSTSAGLESWRVSQNLALDSNGQPGDRGWGLRFESLREGQNAFVVAICASVPDSLGLEAVQATATTGSTGSLGSVSVVCPANKKVLGGGYWSNDGFEVARVWRNRAIDTGGRQTGDRGWGIDFTSVTGGRSFWAQAICGFVN